MGKGKKESVGQGRRVRSKTSEKRRKRLNETIFYTPKFKMILLKAGTEREIYTLIFQKL